MTLQLTDLKESNEFLNALIDNINSAVFIVDQSLKIQQFNRSLGEILGKPDLELMGELWGNAIGCAFAVSERVVCGQTTHCSQCELRRSVLAAFTSKVPTYKQKLIRQFYLQDGPMLKYFEYSTKYIVFEGQEMILLIVDDITESETHKLELLEKQKRIDEDLKAAAGIQQSLLPRGLPEVDALEIAWKFVPCELIGGDIFNVFPLDDEHIGCYMLDVSGHGVPSALVTVSVSQALRPSPPHFKVVPPAEVCLALEDEYPFERFNNFFTIVYMTINFREGYCTYTNAGHPPPVLLRRSGEIELLSTGGPIIGLGVPTSFGQERKELERGDKIIFYTDGLIDHRNEEGEFYGSARLYAKLQELRELSVRKILKELFRSLSEFGGETKLKDDVSLLGIEYKGSYCECTQEKH